MTDEELLDLARAYDQGSGATFEFDSQTIVRLLREAMSVANRNAGRYTWLRDPAHENHDVWRRLGNDAVSGADMDALIDAARESDNGREPLDGR